jgi:hypothetical protein
VYFFGDRVEGGEYVRYDAGGHRADPGYPKDPLSRWWEGLPFDRIDAAFFMPQGDEFPNWHIFINGTQYIRWPIQDPAIIRMEYPESTDNFGLRGLGSAFPRIDAAFANERRTLYMFYEDLYVRRHWRGRFEDPDEPIDSGYPKTIREGWGLDWRRVTAAFRNPTGTIYLFNEHEYVKYSAGRIPNQGPDVDYRVPKTISEGWGPVVASL